MEDFVIHVCISSYIINSSLLTQNTHFTSLGIPRILLKNKHERGLAPQCMCGLS